LVPDGAADHPLDELDGKTPLQAARTPQMDYLASHGVVGRAKTVPVSMQPGSDVANLSLLGYDPKKYYSGRGPLEAASMGIKLDKGDTAFRCNLVTVQDGILTDYSSGHISTGEAVVLIDIIQKSFGNKSYTFYPGISYRHLMVTKEDFSSVVCLPPHNVIGEKVENILPSGRNSQVLVQLMLASKKILEMHNINHTRGENKKNMANMIWLWGQGKALSMPHFKEKYGCGGAIISAVDLVKGIGRCAGLKAIDVPGATGYFDTDYSAKARAALDILKKEDFVFVHVEAPDEAGHVGNIKEKIRAIENFDEKIVKSIFEELKKTGDFKIMVAPDHATPIKVKTHTAEPVPFIIYSSAEEVVDDIQSFSEVSAQNSSLFFEEGFRLIDFMINQN